MKPFKSLLATVICSFAVILCVIPAYATSSQSSTVTVRAQLDDVTDEDSGTYCGVPYHRHVSGVCYDVDGNLICSRAEHEHSDACYVEPADVQTPGFSLLMPSVGGSGVVWIYVAGGVILAVGIVVFVVTRKKNKKEG